MQSQTPRALSSILSLPRIHLSHTPTRTLSTLQARSSFSPLSSSPLSRPRQQILHRNIHSTPSIRKGITPDSADPTPPKPEPNVAGGSIHVTEPSPLSEEQYREYAEDYFNLLMTQLEQLQEDGIDVEAEYSAGVLNVTVPNIGVYVLNKQPPNKQIWLSSPVSGPKRYDWVVQGDKMEEKQDTNEFTGGQWIYLRDGSNLSVLLNKELGVNMTIWGSAASEEV
ncbi:Mitochondrial chaperone Frataxin [Arachnomyces sp. PD_36]|nr:Mitochondrial chaperone Frataxin [Arachnomyces sp. PD_36]